MVTKTKKKSTPYKKSKTVDKHIMHFGQGAKYQIIYQTGSGKNYRSVHWGFNTKEQMKKGLATLGKQGYKFDGMPLSPAKRDFNVVYVHK